MSIYFRYRTLVDVVKLIPEITILAQEKPEIVKGIIEAIKQKDEQGRKIDENRIIGKTVERIIKKIIENMISKKELRIETVNVMYKGGDLDFWVKEEGWDSGLLLVEIADYFTHYFMEIKFTSTNRAHLSKAQSELAGEKRECYFVLVVENGEDLREQLKILQDDFIDQDLIDLLVKNSNVVENIYEKLGVFPNPEELEPDINGYWVKSKLWEDRNNMLEWLRSKFSNVMKRV